MLVEKKIAGWIPNPNIFQTKTIYKYHSFIIKWLNKKATNDTSSTIIMLWTFLY